MDFAWTEDEERFRESLVDFIADHVRPGWTLEDRDMPDAEALHDVKVFCAAMGEAGLLTPHWPAEFGGRDASPWEQAILSEVMWDAGEPRGSQYMNTNWIGPAIMRHGTDEQKALHLPRIAAGDALWCQGFSEPDAGSDLASLQTRAVRTAEGYVINGQKIWTSYAHVAEHCILLARTGEPGSRGAGISIFLVDMTTPGVDVREIPTPFGKHLIHEVFFEDVVVPETCLLGAENEGWQIVLASLADERIGIGRHLGSARRVDEAIDLAGGAPGPGTAAGTAAGLGYAWTEVARAMNYAAVDERVNDRAGTRPLASLYRALVGPMEQAVATACAAVLGERALVSGTPSERQNGHGTVTPIASGSLEIQLNAIARTVLSLPKGK